MPSRRRSQSTRNGHGLVLLLAAAIGACGPGALGPDDLAGTYELRRMNAQPMPYDHEGLGCCTYLSGALVLAPDSYRLSITARNRNNGLVFTAREWGRHEWNAPSLTFIRDSFDLAPFLLDVATVARDSIRVALGGEGPGSPDQFETLFVRAR